MFSLSSSLLSFYTDLTCANYTFLLQLRLVIVSNGSMTDVRRSARDFASFCGGPPSGAAAPSALPPAPAAAGSAAVLLVALPRGLGSVSHHEDFGS
jgi:hypothetical protein